MSDRSFEPLIALAGWGLGAPGLLPARTSWWLERAAGVLVDGEPFGLDAGDPRMKPAPDDPRECAGALARRAAAGERVVWLTEGDPLAGARGRGVALALAAAGAAWEYLPAPGRDAAARAGAVAHVAREAVGDAVWPAWRERYPLLGLTVAVTRAAHQAGDLVAALSRRGADAIETPTIEIADPDDFGPLDAAVERAGSYDWAVFTSANGAERFFARMAATGRDVRDLKGVRVAAIGPASAAAVERRGIRVDLVPGEYVAESLVAALASAGPVSGLRFLVARAAVARDVLPDALRAAGAAVDVVDAYRTVMPEASRDLLVALSDGARLDLVTFTSASTVSNFAALVGAERARAARAACIGPVTAGAARAAGLRVAVEAEEFTVPGLVAAIERWARAEARRPGSYAGDGP